MQVIYKRFQVFFLFFVYVHNLDVLTFSVFSFPHSSFFCFRFVRRLSRSQPLRQCSIFDDENQVGNNEYQRPFLTKSKAIITATMTAAATAKQQSIENRVEKTSAIRMNFHLKHKWIWMCPRSAAHFVYWTVLNS